MSYVRILQRLPEEWRSAMLEFAEAMEERLRAQLAVRRQDFDALRDDVYIFERKVAFYERRHGIKAEGKIIITPMLDPRARPVVDELGIRVYASVYDLGEER